MSLLARVIWADFTTSGVAMKFKHPLNGYTEHGGDILSVLWCLLFGPIYLALRGLWGHALLWIVLAVPTLGISALLYPLFAPALVNAWYRRRGWEEVRGWALFRGRPVRRRRARPVARLETTAQVAPTSVSASTVLPVEVQMFLARSKFQWDFDRLLSMWTLGMFTSGADMAAALASDELRAVV